MTKQSTFDPTSLKTEFMDFFLLKTSVARAKQKKNIFWTKIAFGSERKLQGKFGAK